MKSIKPTILVSFFIISLLHVECVCGQVEVGMGNISGESYLDGLDIEVLMDIKEISLDAEVLSYLDEIEFELVEFDEEFISRGVIDGFYTSLDDCIMSITKDSNLLKEIRMMIINDFVQKKCGIL